MDLNDQLLSIRQWLYQFNQIPITMVTPPYSNLMRLETEGRVRNFMRPQWSIDRLSHRSVDLGAGGYRDDCLWQLTYYGLSRLDADIQVSNLHKALKNDPVSSRFFDRISGYRFNWQYPQPVVLPKADNTTPGLPAGQYSVRVSGIDFCDNESAASVPVLVTLAAPYNELSVRILRVPFMMPMFKAYNLYVNNHLEVAGLPQPGISGGGSNPYYATAILSSLLGTGAAPKEPANSIAVRWKFMRVNSWSDALQEDDEEDGVFNGQITMETSVFQERDQPQPDVVGGVGIIMIVNPTSVQPTPVPQYNILPTNQIIVTVRAG